MCREERPLKATVIFSIVLLTTPIGMEIPSLQAQSTRSMSRPPEDPVFELRVLTDLGANTIQQLARLAQRGDFRAARRLGIFYLTGVDPDPNSLEASVAIDPVEAAHWFRVGAELGDQDCQLRLGLLYHDGLGVEQDYAEAARWLRGPAEAGDVNAQTFMGSLYTRTNENWALDYLEAARWFRMAAEQGSVGATVGIAGLYHNGLGLDLDFQKAMEWYRRAELDATAQFNIGIMYRRGEGVDQDLNEAVEWIERAANQGHTLAQFELGSMYAAGEGVTPNVLQAYKWIDLAVASSAGAEFRARIETRDAIAGQMSEDELARAQRLVQDWQPAH